MYWNNALLGSPINKYLFFWSLNLRSLSLSKCHFSIVPL